MALHVTRWAGAAAVAGALLTPGGPIFPSAAGAAVAGVSVPAGFTVVSRSEPTPGVEYVHLIRAEPPLSVNVARVAPDAEAELRAVLSNEQVAGEGSRLERTSSMCARVGCVLGLNGDFAAVGSNEPIGGLVTDGQLLRTPSETHHQLSVTKDGKLLSGVFEWSGTLVTTDLKPLTLGGVNVDPGGERVVLMTRAWGPTTSSGATPAPPGSSGATPAPPGSSGATPAPPGGAAAGAVALTLKTVEPTGALRLGQTTLVEVTAMSTDGAPQPIPADGGILTGAGGAAKAITDVWERIQSGNASSKALLRLETPARIAESVGGSPILLREGRRWFADVDDNFTRGRHPRTMVGWTPAGEALLVTVDGRAPATSVGMTLGEAADFLLALGATEAVNLDGGGSTTFVTGGGVANQPSDVAVRRGGTETIRHSPQPGDTVIGHVERPVASALMIVPATEVAVPVVDPLAGPSLGLPQALALRAASSTDPGSVPDGDLPALLTEEPAGLAPTVQVVAVALNAAAAVGLLAAVGRGRRNRRPLPAV